MKKRYMSGCLLAGLLAAFVSSAVAQEAYSSSAVGVIKKTIPANKLALISVPLDQESDEGEGFVFQSVPAISNMPVGSIVNFWDTQNQKWILQTKSAKSGWGVQKNRLVAPGECFFIKNPGSTDYELVVSGEVPSDASISRVLPAAALQVVANPYPVPMVFTNFTFAQTLPNGSVANFWDVENQKWILQTKSAKSGWGVQKNREIAPGEGLFVKPSTNVTTATTWTETRPYTWPN